jgi:predicted NAD/FAD-binding protein
MRQDLPPRPCDAGHPSAQAVANELQADEQAGTEGTPGRAARPRAGIGGAVSGRRFAVVGAGVSGLTAAYLLTRVGDVSLFEAEPRLGGHAHTHLVPVADATPIAVDTGFIVYNERTYPQLTRLFAELGVTGQDSEMSMSIRCLQCGLQYAGQRGLAGLQAGLPGGRRYLRLLAEIVRFRRAARDLLSRSDETDPSFGSFLDSHGFSAYFITHFALPFVAAVWSCAPGQALSYPARYMFAFLDNHGLLSAGDKPRWRTVRGGSATYVRRLEQRIGCVRAGAPVVAVRRFPGGAEVRDAAGATSAFDAVVIATHADQALALLADRTRAESAVLGAFRYSRSSVLLHTDPRPLPRSRAARASWNYLLRSCRAAEDGVQVSYYLNRLQRLKSDADYVATLNGSDLVSPDRVLATMNYRHPAYDHAAVSAQRRLADLNDGVIAFAGAYHGWGFHEDGCRSGVAAAESLGARW